MTMSATEKKVYDEIVRDAGDPSVNSGDVLHRMTRLGHVINGDERRALNEAVYNAIAHRPARAP